MRDIQFITLVDNIIVTNVLDEGLTVKLSVRPTALTVSGIEITDFTYGVVTLGTSDFTILSSNEVRFDKPKELINSDFALVDYLFITSKLTNTSDAKLLFNPTTRVISVDGLQKLVQQVIKILLSKSGSNRFSTTEGGNLLDGLGGGTDNIENTIAVIEQSVEQTKTFIRQEQALNATPSAERLSQLEVSEYSVTEDGILNVKITLRTLSGKYTEIPITI